MDGVTNIGLFRIEVRPGYEMPKWYGLSYFERHRDCAVCHRIPLNLAVAMYHWAWLWLKVRFARFLAEREPWVWPR